MRKRGVYLMVGVLMVAGVLVAVFAGREREPEYAGKRLSEWVEVYVTPSRKSEADDAIRHIGTNAVPYLRKWFRYDSSPRKVKFYGVANSLLQKMNHNWVLRDQLELRASCAVPAIRALGLEAETAQVADLSRVMENPDAYTSALRASQVLMGLGHVASVVAGLTNRHEVAREIIVRGLGSLGTNALSAVPALVAVLNDPSADVREAGTNALLAIDAKQLERGTR